LDRKPEFISSHVKRLTSAQIQVGLPYFILARFTPSQCRTFRCETSRRREVLGIKSIPFPTFYFHSILEWHHPMRHGAGCVGPEGMPAGQVAEALHLAPTGNTVRFSSHRSATCSAGYGEANHRAVPPFSFDRCSIFILDLLILNERPAEWRVLCYCVKHLTGELFDILLMLRYWISGRNVHG
jgi:hypothetical protein